MGDHLGDQIGDRVRTPPPAVSKDAGRRPHRGIRWYPRLACPQAGKHIGAGRVVNPSIVALCSPSLPPRLIFNLSHTFDMLLPATYAFIPLFSCLTCRRVADLRKPARGWREWRPCRFSRTVEITTMRPREKSLENGWLFLLHPTLGRVIFELSPGNRKPHQIPRPARAMSVEWSPLCATPTPSPKTTAR